MIPLFVEILGLLAVDVAAHEAAKRYRWLRMIRSVLNVLFCAIIVGLIYLAINYS